MGYSGSQNPKSTPNPTYRNIKDYAETIRLTYNGDKLRYEELLNMFFEMHTPADPRWAGTQYRSAIFVHTPAQRALAEAAVKARGAIGKMVAIEDASDFYKAEDYHQKYIEKQTSGFGGGY